jgi:broad specificity phosphatase PhoE
VRKLILIKHSAPEIMPNVPAHQWALSDDGRHRCLVLAESLAVHQPEVVITSVEAKAAATGRIVADQLNIPFETADNLHEHQRSFVNNQEHFRAQIDQFFAQPTKRVFGMESADEAYQRFANSINRVIDQHLAQTIAIVAHGTVITLFVARSNGIAPLPFWERLDLPSFVVLSIPDFRLLTIVESVVN